MVECSRVGGWVGGWVGGRAEGGKQVQLHLSETTCQQMHVLSSCKPGLLLVTITAMKATY